MNFSEFKNSNHVLSNDKMKNIKGGSGTCGFKVEVAISFDDPGAGTFTWIQCGVSKHEATSMLDFVGNGWWCCDSCGSSSYCG